MTDKIKEYPILFTAPMVRAILDDRKTMTRRVINPQPAGGVRASPFVPSGVEDMHGRELRCPYAKERLWVKETFLHATYVSLAESGDHQMSRANLVEYVADGARPRYLYPGVGGSPYMQKRPSIHMPRWASRINLEIVGVKVERLQDISEEDARAEGVEPWVPAGAALAAIDKEVSERQGWDYPRYRNSFHELWDTINGPESWALNPWVWVISFRRIQGGAR